MHYNNLHSSKRSNKDATFEENWGHKMEKKKKYRKLGTIIHSQRLNLAMAVTKLTF